MVIPFFSVRRLGLLAVPVNLPFLLYPLVYNPSLLAASRHLIRRSRVMIPVKPHIAERAYIKSLERVPGDVPPVHRGARRRSGAEQAADRRLVPSAPRHHGRGHGGGRLLLVLGRAAQRLLQLRRPPPARRRGEKTAIIWAGDEPGEYRHISYREVKHNVARIANVLLAHGRAQGRPGLHLPAHDPRARLLACSPAPGSAPSTRWSSPASPPSRCADRILDAGCKVVITANEGLRGGKRIPLKATVDQAVEGLGVVEKVLVVRRTDKDVPMRQGRDLWLEEETDRQRSTCPVEWMSAEDPLFILYTSGLDGQAQGRAPHDRRAISSTPRLTHKYVFDYHPGDIYMCAADIGWVTGHSYILYGPLANGATTVMFESIPTYPDAGTVLADRRRPRGQHLLHGARRPSGPSPAPATSG